MCSVIRFCGYNTIIYDEKCEFIFYVSAVRVIVSELMVCLPGYVPSSFLVIEVNAHNSVSQVHFWWKPVHLHTTKILLSIWLERSLEFCLCWSFPAAHEHTLVLHLDLQEGNRSPLMGTCRFLTATPSLGTDSSFLMSQPWVKWKILFIFIYLFYEVLMYVALKVMLRLDLVT